MAIVDWFNRNETRVEQTLIRDDGNTIVADVVDANGTKFTVTLKRDSDGQLFIGNHTNRSSGASDICNGLIFFYEGRFLLIGKWHEEGLWYDWVMTNIDI